jgi:hypothetical protein
VTLPDAITEALPPDDRLRVGIVASVHPTTVDIQGTLVPAGALSPYTAVIGDNVAVLRQDSTWLILGRIASPSGQFPQFQAGAADLTVAAGTSATLIVPFAIPFATIPSVSTNISTGAGAVSGWGSRAINVTNTSFTIFIFGAASSFTANVQWQAQEMTQ